MLLLVPGFALTMILEGNSLTRSFSLYHQTFVSPRALRQLQTCLGKAGLHWQLLEALLLNIQIPVLGPQEQLSPTPREGGVPHPSRSAQGP